MKDVTSILVNATGNVLGVVIKCAELLEQGPSGLVQPDEDIEITTAKGPVIIKKYQYVAVTWDYAGVKHSLVLIFHFRKDGHMGIADLKSGELNFHDKFQLDKKMSKLFDYAAIKAKQGELGK
ncbi:MAG: hypothetical protein ACFFF4_09975 [Candidatus Thorarchaeota archaeon]